METAQMIELINTSWILVAAALVFFMQAGFLALEVGLTRRKNNINVAAKNLIDFAVAVVLYWLFGFGIMHGLTSGGIMGSTFFSPDLLNMPMTAAQGSAISLPTFFLFQAMFCGTAVTIISGASAERMRFESYLVVSMVVSAFVYPFVGHWIWGGMFFGRPEGWLGALGFVDFAGSTVVHSVGGWSALALLVVLGPRTDRFKKDGAPNQLAKANLPLATLGTFILWFGWFGFNGGSSLLTNGSVSVVMVNTVLAGAAGMLAVFPIRILASRGAVEADYLINGALAGLVAITASAHAVHPQAAMIIGFIGAWVMLFFDWGLLRLGIDDAVGAVPVHLGAGMWGTLAVALFGDPQFLGTGLNFVLQFGVQLIGIFATAGWAFLTTIIFVGLVDLLFSLRVTPAEEKIGLNISEQGAEPDYSEYPGLEELLANYRQELILQSLSNEPPSSPPPAPSPHAAPFEPIPET
ncbi:MAG: ammonium transporter [Caldilineaceae bacterium]